MAVAVVLLLLCLAGLGVWVLKRRKQPLDLGAGRRGVVSDGGGGGGGGGGLNGGLKRASTMILNGVGKLLQP